MNVETAFNLALATIFTLMRAYFRCATRLPRAPRSPDAYLLRALIPFEIITLLTYLFVTTFICVDRYFGI